MGYWTHEEVLSTTGAGTTLDMSLQPSKYYSLQVSQETGVVLLWTVLLEVSLGGTDWTTIIMHVNGVNSLGQIVIPATTLIPFPASFLRFRVTGLTVGTSVRVRAMAMD